MAMVIDDRSNVWEDKDQPRVHVVPAFTPYYAPQAEVLKVIMLFLYQFNFILAYFYLDKSHCSFNVISSTDSKSRSCPLCSKKCCMQCQRLLFQVRLITLQYIVNLQ